MASFTSFPTPHVAQPIRYSRSLSTAKTSATRGNCAIAYFPPLHAARPIAPETTFPYTYCPRRAEIPAFGKAALPRLFARTHSASHCSRRSLSVPSSRPRRTESLNLRLNGATAFFQRHARRNQSFQRPLSRTHIVRDARKLPTFGKAALSRLFARTHSASHCSRRSLSVPSSRPRRTETPSFGETALSNSFQRHT